MICSFVALSAIALVAIVNAQEPTQRWAILPAPEVQQAGLSDLLTVELSQPLEPVELSQLSASHGVKLRLKIGPEFIADRLIILTLDKSVTPSHFLKVVVCKTGHRL